MTTTEEPGVSEALGLPPIDVFLPCTICYHPIEQHAEVPGKNIKGACSGKLGSNPCTCESFEGGFPDGSPRGMRLRQLSAIEYSTLRKGFSVPIILSDDTEQLTPEERADADLWSRALVRRSVQACRFWNIRVGVVGWHAMRILDEDEISDDPWEISIEQLDSVNRNNMVILTAAILRDLEVMPDGVEVLRIGHRFRKDVAGSGSDVSRDSVELREDAPRDSDGDSGPSGSADSNAQPDLRDPVQVRVGPPSDQDREGS